VQRVCEHVVDAWLLQDPLAKQPLVGERGVEAEAHLVRQHHRQRGDQQDDAAEDSQPCEDDLQSARVRTREHRVR
jgi:hypothetical protein